MKEDDGFISIPISHIMEMSFRAAADEDGIACDDLIEVEVVDAPNGIVNVNLSETYGRAD